VSKATTSKALSEYVQPANPLVSEYSYVKDSAFNVCTSTDMIANSIDIVDNGNARGLYNFISTSRWSTIMSYPWRYDEHINTLELRALLSAIRWSLSYPSSITSRVICMLDSSVCVFAVRKGRSSAPTIGPVMRQLSAMLLASGMSLLPIWIPSEWNPADAPSRLL
jgi:hypothetical protein